MWPSVWDPIGPHRIAHVEKAGRWWRRRWRFRCRCGWETNVSDFELGCGRWIEHVESWWGPDWEKPDD